MIKTGRLLYRKSDSSAGPATETVFDDNFTEQRSWAGIRRCDHKTSSEMTDLFVNLRGNEKTRDHRKNQQKKRFIMKTSVMNDTELLKIKRRLNLFGFNLLKITNTAESVSLALLICLLAFLGFHIFHHAAFFAHLTLGKFVNLSFKRIFSFHKFKTYRSADNLKCISEIVG